MTIIRPAENTHFQMPEVSFAGLVSPKQGSTENSLWKFVLAPRSPGVRHQVSREEIILVTSGGASVELAGVQHNVEAGDAIIIPAYTDFCISNDRATDFEGIAVLPVGGQAVLEGQPPFTPPWAE